MAYCILEQLLHEMILSIYGNYFLNEFLVAVQGGSSAHLSTKFVVCGWLRFF